MSIKDDYRVETIPLELITEWLTRKHYAHRIPAIITHSFALYRNADGLQQGVCTYSLPPRNFNNGYGIFGDKLKIPTWELSRLVVNEGLPRNTLSFFVAQTFGFFPRPCVLVSYADGNYGHHGYIYQATNWIYTGATPPAAIFRNKNTGEQIHRRTLSGIVGSLSAIHPPDWIEVDYEESGKHRYFQFLGTKQDVANMKAACVYPVQPYPKGDNTRYDAGFNPAVQQTLF